MREPDASFPAPRNDFSSLESERIAVRRARRVNRILAHLFIFPSHSLSQFEPRLPKVLKGEFVASDGEAQGAMGDHDKIEKLFPKSYGMPRE